MIGATAADPRLTRLSFFACRSRIALVFSARSVSSFSICASYCASSIDALLQLQRGDLLLDRVLLVDERLHRRIAQVDGERRLGAAGAEKHRRRQPALAAVVQRRVLGEQQPFLLKGLRHLRLRVLERLGDRDVAVAIAVGGVVAERGDEELGELRLVALAAGLGRGDDHAAGRGDRRQERAARAAGVDEGDALRRQLGEQLRPVGDGQIGPGQVERRLRAVEAAVADEQDDDGVVRLDARARDRRTPSRRRPCVDCLSASSVMLASGTASFFFAASMKLVAHFWNFFACSSSPGTPVMTSRCVCCANAGDARQHADKRRDKKKPQSTQRSQRKIFSACSLRSLRSPRFFRS